MKIDLVAVGERMPTWVKEAWQEYAKRLHCPVNLIEIPLQKRKQSLAQIQQQETSKILQKIPSTHHLVLLSADGTSYSSEQFSQRYQQWQLLGKPISLLIGGPEGISSECRKRADETCSLSAFTFPHPLVRIIIIEQLYRAQCILQQHPYHK